MGTGTPRYHSVRPRPRGAGRDEGNAKASRRGKGRPGPGLSLCASWAIRIPRPICQFAAAPSQLGVQCAPNQPFPEPFARGFGGARHQIRPRHAPTVPASSPRRARTGGCPCPALLPFSRSRRSLMYVDASSCRASSSVRPNLWAVPPIERLAWLKRRRSTATRGRSPALLHSGVAVA